MRGITNATEILVPKILSPTVNTTYVTLGSTGTIQAVQYGKVVIVVFFGVVIAYCHDQQIITGLPKAKMTVTKELSKWNAAPNGSITIGAGDTFMTSYTDGTSGIYTEFVYIAE